MIAISNSNNDNTPLNLAVDLWLEGKEIGPDIQKWIWVYMALKTNDRVLMWILTKGEDKTLS